MLSLSTSWNSSKHTNGCDLIEEIRSAGFDSVELNFALTKAIVDDILVLRQSGAIKVSSLHNMCPLPQEIGPKQASPDYYSLASEDQEEREHAVSIAKTTIDYAAKFGARAMVLHAGRVGVKDHTQQLAALVGENKDFIDLRERMIAERARNSAAHLKNTIRSLEELAAHGKKMMVSIGVENRYYYNEMPIMDEFEIIFKHFSPGELFYWHDVGHAEVFDRLGFCRHKALLESFGDRLLGIHLHDIIGPISDHRAPGHGTFDFSIVKPYIKSDTIKVLEVHQPVTAEEICGSVEYLRKVLGNDLLGGVKYKDSGA